MALDLKFAVETLIKLGLTEEQIAQCVKTSQPTVHRIKNGAEPKYRLGCRIAELYQEQVPSK